MEQVTDGTLLNELNRSRHIQTNLMPKIEKLDDPGAAKTGITSAITAAPGALGNLMMKLGLSSPDVMQEALYGKGEAGIKARKEHEQGQMAHPIADIAGSVAGFGPLGIGTSSALRAIPGVGRMVEAASPSLLKRTGVHALEGGAIGSLYSQPGNEGEGFGLGALIGGALGGPGISLAKNARNIGNKAGRVSNIEELGMRRNEAQGMHEEQQAIIDLLKKKYAEQGIGMQSPESITRNINERMGKIGDLQENANIPHEQTENLLNWPGGEELLPNATTEKNMHIKEMEHYLRAGTAKDNTMDVEAANEVRSSIKKVKQHIQQNYYKPVEEYTKNNYVKLPRTADIKKIEEQLSKLSNDPIFKSSPGFEKLKQELIKQGSGHDLVPANDFVKQWKETKQAASKAQRKGYQEGGENQSYWQDQSAHLKELADQQLKILEQHLPKTYYDKLLGANKLWREEVAPFYGNKIYEQVKKLGRIDVGDIPKELRGSGKGQEKMQELFLANPKLTRLALGHSHAKNPESLLNPAPHEQPFIEQLPQLQAMIDRLHGHNRKIEIAKAQHKMMQENQSRTKVAHEELVKQQAARQKATKEIEKLSREVVNLHKKRTVLSENLEKGHVSKKEFERLDTGYKEALKNKNSLMKKLAKAASYSAAVFGLSNIIK